MRPLQFAALALGLIAGPALADGHATGDAAEGEKVFRKCKACHAIVDAAGESIAKGGKTGPNLYGINARVAGAEEGFARYGDDLAAAGAAGLEWNQADFVSYVQDPRGFLRTYLDDKGAKSKMTFKLRDEEDAIDVWTYLVSVGPEPEQETE